MKWLSSLFPRYKSRTICVITQIGPAPMLFRRLHKQIRIYFQEEYRLDLKIQDAYYRERMNWGERYRERKAISRPDDGIMFIEIKYKEFDEVDLVFQTLKDQDPIHKGLQEIVDMFRYALDHPGDRTQKNAKYGFIIGNF